MGIEVLGDGVSVAKLRTRPTLEVEHAEFLVAENQQSAIHRLQDFVAAQGLKGAPCNAVLEHEEYSVLLSEAPNVPEEELRDAMQWKLREISPIPIDQAVVDVFPVPEDAGNVMKGKVFAVVARKESIEKLTELIESSGLRMNAIDIPELALRNLSEKLAMPNRSVVFSQHLGERTYITAICNGNVYLNRSCSLHVEKGVLDPFQVDSLILELQRSVDYIQHQMMQPTPSHILLFSTAFKMEEVPEALASNFSCEVKGLDIAEILPVPAGADKSTLGKCALAVGAALRNVAGTENNSVSETRRSAEVA